jgi:GT2 family glycosyltransferase
MRCELAEVSVIVPTRNEAGQVAAFLAGLAPEVELVVVDASDDGTGDLFRDLRPARTHVIRNAAGVAAARQLGAQASRGTWLLFTDADVCFGPDYFQRLAGQLVGDAFYGSKHTTTSYARYGRLFTRCQQALHRAGVPAASGSNMAVRREVFERVGGFRQDLPVNEDTELMMRLRHRGFAVRFVPELAVRSLDDRRLEGGLAFKSLHSLARGLLLWLELRLPLPARWLRHDWGYWRRGRGGGPPDASSRLT